MALQSSKYVQYNIEPQVFDLDRNVWRASAGTIADGATGRHLYANEPRHPAYNLCFSGRDPETHYIIGKERDTHPDHASRFGYANCENGYCSGHFPGKYIVSDACQCDPQPPNAAPERFYTEPYQTPFQDRTQASVDYAYWKNVGMNW